MRFTQIIEFDCNRIDDIISLDERWEEETRGRRAQVSTQFCRSRDDDSHYVAIVQFESYEEAQRNNELPETTAFAEQLQKISEGPIRYVNLDVIQEYVDK